MIRYLSSKYNLLLNINNRYVIPKEIWLYIMTLVYNLVSPVRVFAGVNNTIIIRNNMIYGYGSNILGKQYHRGRINIKNIIPDTIKKIAFGVNYSLILCYDTKVYMCGSFNIRSSVITYIMPDIKDISADSYSCAYITSKDELYIHITDMSPIKVDIKNVNMAYHRGWSSVEIILNDGQYIGLFGSCYDCPAIKELVSGSHHKIAITYNNEVVIWPVWNSNNWIMIPNVSNVKMISCCDDSSYILTNDGELYIYEKSDINLLNKKYKLPPIESIHSGTHHVIMITVDGRLYGYRDDSCHQLNLAGYYQYLPIQITL